MAIQKLLNPGETVIISNRQHIKALFKPLAILLLLLVIGVAIQALVGTDGWERWITYIAWILVAVAVLAFVVWPFLQWLTTVHTITDRRLITRRGILTRVSADIPLPRISDTSVEINLLDRPFGCGTLLITSASEREPVRLKDIPRIEEANRRLNELLHQATPPQRPADDGA